MISKSIYLFPVAFLYLAISPSIAQEPKILTTQKEKISYALGVSAAKDLRKMELDIDLEMLIKAFRDVYSDGKLLLDDTEIKAAMTAYQVEAQKKQAEVVKTLTEKNKKEGEAFLADNKTKEGVILLPSGLQYKILKQGSGAKPKESDTVEIDYRGTLINGTEFDSSYKQKQSVNLQISAIFPGLKEALILMPVGSKWQLFIPSGLAYGERGSGRDIEPNATLIFEVELLAIKATAEQNKKIEETFLTENKTKEGVIALPSGLQYKILKQGAGEKPQDADTVEVNYRGTLIDGTEFDSSYKRGQSSSFPVNGIISGWREALKLMPVGSKWQLFIPSNLAYGEKGTGRDIGPNAMLIFEVELIAIKPNKPTN
jgi:FKBP-type peptidyl-prolyl cis-trans isomerase